MKIIDKSKYLTSKELKKLPENSYILFHTNRLYYLMNYYQNRKTVEGIREHFIKCLNILYRWQRDLEVLSYYGYHDTQYYYLPVKDAKILLFPWINHEYPLQPNTMMKCDYCPYDIKQLRKKYKDDKERDEKQLKLKKEIVFRKENGYML